MATRTVENYLKQLYLVEQADGGTGGELVAMSRLAQQMGVVAGTATTMVRALADSGLVVYEPRGGVRLTAAGEQLALHVLRRHRLVELFLVRALGLDWSEVRAEAEELEHVISERLLERIDAYLDHPTTDPHGDPIPTKNLQVAPSDGQSLATCPLQQPVEISRILDQEPAFLQFAQQRGLRPGTRWRVQQRSPEAQTVEIAGEEPDGGVIMLSAAAAGKFLVRAV